MRAWRIAQHGSLQRVEQPRPEPGPGEARVRVEYVGLNHLDVWVRKGVPGHKFPLPLTPGCDIVGQAEGFGPVVVNPGVSCGRCEACLSGFDPLCRDYGILGETRDGGCADEITVPVANLIPLPKGLSPESAAALPIPYLTAWTMLFRKAELRPGQTVLIRAAGSGVSVACIQLARMIGATVVATTGSKEKVERAKRLGADHVFMQGEKIPFRFDVVVDHVGVDTFQESLKCLKWGGKLVTCGATTGSEVKLDLKAVFFKNLSILGVTMGSKADLLRIVELAAGGKISPVIDRVLPMGSLPEAMSLLESRQIFGKIVLRQD